MTSREPEHHPNNLPADLHEVESRLTRLARSTLRDATPAGLEDRVFQASVGLLPAMAGRSRRTADRAVVVGRIGFAQLGWGRMAMAASLGLAVVVAAFFMSRPLPVDPQPDGEFTFAADLSWLRVVSFKEERQVAHLLDTGDLSSYAELAIELQAVIAEVGM